MAAPGSITHLALLPDTNLGDVVTRPRPRPGPGPASLGQDVKAGACERTISASGVEHPGIKTYFHLLNIGLGLPVHLTSVVITRIKCLIQKNENIYVNDVFIKYLNTSNHF